MAMVRCDSRLKAEIGRFRRLMVAASKVGIGKSQVIADAYREDTEAGILRTALAFATNYARETYKGRKRAK